MKTCPPSFRLEMEDDGVDGISEGVDGHSDDDAVPSARPARAVAARRAVAVPVVDSGGPVLFALLASTDADTYFKGVCDNRVTPLLNFADPVTILVGFFCGAMGIAYNRANSGHESFLACIASTTSPWGSQVEGPCRFFLVEDS